MSQEPKEGSRTFRYPASLRRRTKSNENKTETRRAASAPPTMTGSPESKSEKPRLLRRLVNSSQEREERLGLQHIFNPTNWFAARKAASVQEMSTQNLSRRSIRFDDEPDNKFDVSAITDSGLVTQNEFIEMVDVSASSTTVKTLVVGPVLDFLTADATLFLLLTIGSSIYPTYKHWASIQEGNVPLTVALTWLSVAFAIGQIFSLDFLKTSHLMLPLAQSMLGTPSEIVVHDQQVTEEVLQHQKRQRHSILLRAVPNAKITFEAVKAPVAEVLRKGAAAWTNLNPKGHAELFWEKTVDPTLDMARNNILMNRLLKNPAYKRQTKLSMLEKRQVQMGLFPLDEEVDTLNEFVIIPMMKLRGMDVFLTEDPESETPSHPYLIQHGLRDVPTAVVNIVTQWANILIYLEMPEWVTTLEGIEEDESDDEDVKALKRFLNGTDEYRNERMKMIPSVVDGPLAVRLLAPPKRETIVSCSILPIKWRKFEANYKDGRYLHPALEVELDCLSNRAMRVMAGILKRNLKSLSIDIAVVISKPADQEQEEPQACIGMWRFNFIDVSACPHFPDRFAMNESSNSLLRNNPDVARASTIMRISAQELEDLANDYDD